jgi:tetratricopeptide (TPR) repeat protein
MKENSPQASSVAWFKLAECVNRGEKERALNLYRLLLHSHEEHNEAFMKKLEADLLVEFDLKEALREYVSAAHHYSMSGKDDEALFIYERIISLAPGEISYLQKAIFFSGNLKKEEKATHYKKDLYQAWLHKGEIEKAVSGFESVEKMLDDSHKFQFYRDFVISSLTHKYTNQKVITSYLHKALDGLLRFGSDREVQQFLSEIQAINSVWHKDAVSYLKK